MEYIKGLFILLVLYECIRFVVVCLVKASIYDEKEDAKYWYERDGK